MTTPTSSPERRRSVAKLIRNLLAVALLLFVGFQFYRSQTSVTSRTAFVNAKVYALRTPIGGTVAYQRDLNLGDTVANGQMLATVTNQSLVDELHVEQELEAQLANARVQAGLLGRQLRERQGLLSEMTQGGKTHTTLQSAYQQKLVEAANQSYQQSTQNLENTRAQASRYAHLAEKGYISAVRAQNEQNNYTLASTLVQERKAGLDATRKQYEASSHGMQISGDQPQSFHAVQSLEARKEVMGLRQAIAQYQASIPILSRQLSDVRQQRELARKAQVVSPVRGVIWATPARNHEVVKQNDPVLKVLDCGASWVDAYLDEADLEKIDPAQPVRVRSVLGNHQYQGRVRFVRSGINKFSVDEGSVQGIDTVTHNKALVRVDVAWPKEGAKAPADKGKAPCLVGQTVEVSFARVNSLPKFQ